MSGRRLLAAFVLDLRIQRRAGVHAVVGVLALVWIAVLRVVPAGVRAAALPPVVTLDLATVGVYVMAAAVLFEKGQRTLDALAVTPLQPGEYLGAKVASLSLAAAALAAAVVIVGHGGRVTVVPLAAGVVLTAVVTLLAAFVLVAPHATLATFLLPSGLLAAVLIVPPVAAPLGASASLLALWPTGGGYALVRAGVIATAAGELWAAVVAQSAWVVLLAAFARRAYRRHLVGGGRR